MRIKLIEGGELKVLRYRPWNGVQYGADQSEEIVKQYSKTILDRASQAYVMSRGTYRFWEKYFEELTEDEQQIRAAYLAYHPSDVEEHLRRELDAAGDDVRLHHKARQTALKTLAKAFPGRAKLLADRVVKTSTTMAIRLNYKQDADIMEYLAERERLNEVKAKVIKRLLRDGIKQEKARDEEKRAAIAKAKKEGWI